MTDVSLASLAEKGIPEIMKVLAETLDEIHGIRKEEVEYSVLVVRISALVGKEGILIPSRLNVERRIMSDCGVEAVANHRRRYHELVTLEEKTAYLRGLLKVKEPSIPEPRSAEPLTEERESLIKRETYKKSFDWIKGQLEAKVMSDEEAESLQNLFLNFKHP